LERISNVLILHYKLSYSRRRFILGALFGRTKQRLLKSSRLDAVRKTKLIKKAKLTRAGMYVGQYSVFLFFCFFSVPLMQIVECFFFFWGEVGDIVCPPCPVVCSNNLQVVTEFFSEQMKNYQNSQVCCENAKG